MEEAVDEYEAEDGELVLAEPVLGCDIGKDLGHHLEWSCLL